MQSGSQGCKIERGAYPPNRGEIPTADHCATKKERANSAGAGGHAHGGDTSAEILVQLRRTNNLAEISLLTRNSALSSSSAAPAIPATITPQHPIGHLTLQLPTSIHERKFQSLLGKRNCCWTLDRQRRTLP
mmetsp:Transcript_20220/g.44977  ORF Transcript_20220/g.44977 Transcript_20220/m.44977 type:complete len:132 (+) Transcript_20220:762-1157(+)